MYTIACLCVFVLRRSSVTGNTAKSKRSRSSTSGSADNDGIVIPTHPLPATSSPRSNGLLKRSRSKSLKSPPQMNGNCDSSAAMMPPPPPLKQGK